MREQVCMGCKYFSFIEQVNSSKHIFMQRHFNKIADGIKKRIAETKNYKSLHVCDSNLCLAMIRELRRNYRAMQQDSVSQRQAALKNIEEDISRLSLKLVELRIDYEYHPANDKLTIIRRMEIEISRKKTILAQRSRRLKEILKYI